MVKCPFCTSWFSLRRKDDGKCQACHGSGEIDDH